MVMTHASSDAADDETAYRGPPLPTSFSSLYFITLCEILGSNSASRRFRCVGWRLRTASLYLEKPYYFIFMLFAFSGSFSLPPFLLWAHFRTTGDVLVHGATRTACTCGSYVGPQRASTTQPSVIRTRCYRPALTQLRGRGDQSKTAFLVNGTFQRRTLSGRGRE